MAWLETGDKLFSESIMARVADTYMRQLASIIW